MHNGSRLTPANNGRRLNSLLVSWLPKGHLRLFLIRGLTDNSTWTSIIPSDLAPGQYVCYEHIYILRNAELNVFILT